MKKILALLLCLVMLVSVFAGCSNETPGTTGTTEPGNTTTAPSNPTDATNPSTAPSDPTDVTDPSNPSAPSDPTDPSNPSGGTEEIKVITIAEALVLCGEPGNITTERYYIRGIIDSISNPTYGQMTISDGTGTINVYGTYSAR